MADKITYPDKIGVTPKETHINQVWDDDMNEIKLKVNNNADLLETVEAETDVNTLDIVDLESNRAFKNVILSKVANYTANINEYIQVNASTGAITITLPTAIGVTGQEINVTKTDSTGNNVIINTSLTQTINGEDEIRLINQYTNVTLVSNNLNWIIK